MNSDRSDDDIQVTILAWLDRQGADVAAKARPLSELLVGTDLSLDEFNHAIGSLVEPGHVRRESTESAGSALDARFWITPAGRANAKERIQPLAPWSNLGHGYRTTDKKLMYRGNPLPGVDRGSFEILNLHWARDQKSVFNVGRKLKADRDSFRELNCLFARDKDTIFCFAGPAKFLDVESFEVLDSGGFCSEESNWPPIHVGFCRDKSGVYYYDIGCHKPRLLKGADAESFTPMGYGFARDRAHCYYNYTTLKVAKPESFELLSQRFSRDAERVSATHLKSAESIAIRSRCILPRAAGCGCSAVITTPSISVRTAWKAPIPQHSGLRPTWKAPTVIGRGS